MKLVLLTILTLIISGCGGSDDPAPAPPPPPPEPKELFSFWEDTLDGSPLDLRNGSFNEYIPYFSVYDNGGVCGCQVIIIGNERQGTYSITSCYVASQPFNPNINLRCDLLVSVGTYSNDGTNLRLTDGFGSRLLD